MLQAPLPNLGTCKETGKFPDEQLASCQACIKKNDDPLTEPGTKYFYCHNKCYNSYAADGIGCDYSDLVAKTIDQCSNPCKQVALPAARARCSDDFDCNSGETCSMGKCVTKNSNVLSQLRASSLSDLSTPQTSMSMFVPLILIVLIFILLLIFLVKVM